MGVISLEHLSKIKQWVLRFKIHLFAGALSVVVIIGLIVAKENLSHKNKVKFGENGTALVTNVLQVDYTDLGNVVSAEGIVAELFESNYIDNFVAINDMEGANIDFNFEYYGEDNIIWTAKVTVEIIKEQTPTYEFNQIFNIYN